MFHYKINECIPNKIFNYTWNISALPITLHFKTKKVIPRNYESGEIISYNKGKALEKIK